MKKFKFKWPTKEEFLRLGKKLFSWLPFFVACGFTLFAAVFFIVPTEDAEAAEAASDVTDWGGKLPSEGAQLSSLTDKFKVKYYFNFPFDVTIYRLEGNRWDGFEQTNVCTENKTIFAANLAAFRVCYDSDKYNVLETKTPNFNSGGRNPNRDYDYIWANITYENRDDDTGMAFGNKGVEYDEFGNKVKEYIDIDFEGDPYEDDNDTPYAWANGQVEFTPCLACVNMTIENADETSKKACNCFYWPAHEKITKTTTETGSMTVPFWYDGISAPPKDDAEYSAKYCLKEGYSLKFATVKVGDTTYNKNTNSDNSPVQIFDNYVLFKPSFVAKIGGTITISGVVDGPIFKDLKIDCSDLKGNPLLGLNTKVSPDFFNGQLSAEFTEKMAIGSYFKFDNRYQFKCTSTTELYDVSNYTIGLYSDSDFKSVIPINHYYVSKTNGAWQLTFSKTNPYYDDVYILVSKIEFKFHNLNIYSQDNIKSIKYNQFKINDSGSWAQTGDPTNLTGVANMLPNNYAFEFDINFDDDCQYNLENLGYLYTCPYTYKADDTNAKINDVLSIITDNDGKDIKYIKYNFTFYADRLHIYIPEDIITSDITVTIKQGPEKFVDCLNSFDFENEDIKNNVSVYGMQMIQPSLGDDTVMAVTGDKIDYEIVKNSRTYYYAVKLLVNDSQEGYNYTFDNFGVESSRGARIKILNGEELDKIGLKDDDHIRYISVYLEDPNATDHRISFTGIYTTLKTIEIKLSDNSIEEMKADSFIGAIEPQFSSENKKWTMKLYHGQYLNFTVVPKEGYYLNRSDILTISSQGGSYEVQLNELGSNMGVLVHNIKGDLKLEVNAQQAPLSITFEDIEGFKYYSVNESNGNINSIGDQIFDIVTVDPDSDYYFAVKADNGYDLSTVSLKNHDTDLSNISIDEQYKYYKIEKIQQYAKISGTVEKIKYKIIFNSSSSDATPGSDESKAVITYTQDDEQISSLNIVHGESISFEVGLEDRFSNSKIKVYSKWDDGSAEEIFAFDGIYTLSNIMHNCEVYVEGVELNQYIINFVENDKVQYELDGKLKSSDAISVKHGDNYNFKLIPKKGYQITDKTIVNHRTVEGTTSLKPTSAGNYTISNMLQDCTIIVENAEDIIYKISFKNQGGVTYRNRDGDVITESLSIKYGENFEFAVELDDAYDDSIQGMKPIANDDKSINSRVNKLAEGKYLISNVIEDINLEVLNVRKNRYTVNLVKMEGVDFHNGSGKVITGPNEVEHGESLNFKVYVYPAYDGSKLKVMLGDNPLAAQTAGDYLVEGVTENKTVTVIGVEESLVTRLINTINNLPNPISDLDDVDKVIEASKMYQLIPADQRHLVTNISVLNSLQDQSKGFHHVNNGITVEGISWRIKLVAVPISSSTEACSRIYKKLDSEYILSLYDVYFWDTVNEVRYKPAKEQTITLTLPKPDLKYFENATGVCGDAKGDVDFLSLTFSGNSVHININSPGYIGVIADRTSTPGRSSLLDAADANWETLTNALSSFGIGSSKEDKSQGTSIFNDIENDSDSNDIIQEETGNISEKYKSRNNKVTAQGSAIRLVLVLMIIILIAVIVWVIVKKRKERKAMDN